MSSVTDFFPDPPDVPDHDDVDSPQPVWMNPPDDVLPGVVPVELFLGRSEEAVVMLSGMRAFPAGVAMTLLVRTRTRIRTKRFSLHEELFDGPYRHDQDEAWQRGRLKWGIELADGRRVTNVDPWPDPADPRELPDRPVLFGGGGGGDDRAVDRHYWLWPLPPPGPLTVVLQWPMLGIEQTTTRLDADEIIAAAARSQPVWPPD